MIETSQMTRLATNEEATDFEDSDSGSDMELNVKDWKERNPSKCSTRVVILAGLLIVAVASICVIAIALSHPPQTNLGEDEAFITLQDLMQQNEFDRNGDDEKSFESAFASFDGNDDGFLNQTEFAHYFALELDYSQQFERLDVDNDDIISYPEAVAYVQESNKIDGIRQQSLSAATLGCVQMRYGFEFSAENSSDSVLFNTYLEYLALLTYFESFDSDSNGYIPRAEFYSKASYYDFLVYDLNSDGELSVDEFYSILYGSTDDQNSWNYELFEMYGDDYQRVMMQLAAVQITEDMTRNMQINVSPIKTLRNSNSKRRLACRWETRVTYSSACNCWTTSVVYICD